MKNLLLSLLTGALAFFIVYLLGAFYNVTFDISKFETGSRAGVCVMGGLAYLLAFMVAFTRLNLNKDDK